MTYLSLLCVCGFGFLSAYMSSKQLDKIFNKYIKSV